jgi:HEAT repeat protein
MIPTKTGQIRCFILYCLVLSLPLVSLGCSSKDDRDDQEQETAESSTIGENTKSLTEEIAKLKLENTELKKTLADSLAKEKELERLRTQNAQIRQAITEIIALIEQSGTIDTKNERFRKALDLLSAVEDGNNQYVEQNTDAMELVKKFDSLSTTQEKLDYLESLDELVAAGDLAVLSVVWKALDDPDPAVGRAAIALIEDYRHPDVIPVLEHALQSTDEQIRADALEPLSNIDDPQVSQLLIQAMNDDAQDIRRNALVIAEDKNDSIQLPVLAKGISSKHDDIKYGSASLLEDRGDHKAMDIIIEGLKDPDPAFREEINEVLNFLVSREFKSYEEARTWWNQNKNRYDDELFEKDN